MSKRTVVIAGITLNVFALDGAEPGGGESASPNSKPVAILFLLHGRMSRADHVELVAKAFLDEVSKRRRDPEQAGKEAHDLWVVTFVGLIRTRGCYCEAGEGYIGFHIGPEEPWDAVGR